MVSKQNANSMQNIETVLRKKDNMVGNSSIFYYDFVIIFCSEKGKIDPRDLNSITFFGKLRSMERLLSKPNRTFNRRLLINFKLESNLSCLSWRKDVWTRICLGHIENPLLSCDPKLYENHKDSTDGRSLSGFSFWSRFSMDCWERFWRIPDYQWWRCSIRQGPSQYDHIWVHWPSTKAFLGR